jgi:hypothetical protein
MTFKIMATVAAVIIAAAANCGCSGVPSGTYGASGPVAAGPVAVGRVSYAATSPAVTVPGERVVGADPDANVRFDLNRNAGFYLHGGGSGN